MERKGLKLSLAIVFLVLVVFGFSSNTISTSYAAINSSYSEATKTETEDLLIEDKVKESVILDALASFVYAIASLVENIVGGIFTSISGEHDFPWADRVIFNAIPLLDVNFFNPSSGSFFSDSDKQDTIIAKIVRNTYFTVLAICIAFLTVVVAIAAIRMALTALASEKAKYKEAITKWMFSIVLIFLMHNLMAFIFYLNESLVEVASSILVNNMQDSEVIERIKKRLEPELNDADRVYNFIDSNSSIFSAVANHQLSPILPNFIAMVKQYVQGNDAASYLTESEENIKIASVLLQDSKFCALAIPHASDGVQGSGLWAMIKSGAQDYWNGFLNQLDFTSPAGDDYGAIPVVADTVKKIKEYSSGGETDQIIDLYKNCKTKDEWLQAYRSNTNGIVTAFQAEDIELEWAKYQYNMAKIIKKYHDAMYKNNTFVGYNSLSGKSVDILKDLASFFKANAFSYTTDGNGDSGSGDKITGWRASKISVTGALIYGIFVAQSILYLFSYTKRFFYIVVLALLAPVVVLFDFLGKAVS